MTLHRPRSMMDGDVEWVAIYPCPTPVRPFAPLIGDSRFVAYGHRARRLRPKKLPSIYNVADCHSARQGRIRTDALFSTVASCVQ